MSDQNSTTINTGGGAFNAVASAVGGRDHHVEATISNVGIASRSESGASVADLLALLSQLRDSVRDSTDLPAQAKSDLEHDLAGAAQAVDRPEPSPGRAMTMLKSVQATLEAVGGAATSALGLGGLVAKAIQLASQIVL